MKAVLDLSCKNFGKLYVIKQDGFNKNGNAMWQCECECGNIKTVASTHLVTGHTKSCGCINLKHGMEGTRQYKIWRAMLDRCFNKNLKAYKTYGAIGITVCSRWHKFENFWEDMKDGYSDNLTIDRKDNNKGYFKENCRWATRIEQSNNRKCNKLMTYNGEIKTLAEWARYLNINTNTLMSRYYRNWDIGDVLRPNLHERRVV